MNVLVNGERCDLPEGCTVDEAVERSGEPTDGRGVAVAIDGEVVPRGRWSATEVRAGQKIEVLQAVQGG